MIHKETIVTASTIKVGKVIGTEGAKDQFPNNSKYAVFDNDPLTFFDSVDVDSSWAGLEFDM